MIARRVVTATRSGVPNVSIVAEQGATVMIFYRPQSGLIWASTRGAKIEPMTLMMMTMIRPNIMSQDILQALRM